MITLHTQVLKKGALSFLAVFFCILGSQIVYAGVAPDFTLTDVDGHVFSLNDFRGKVVILDFFATYCSPCRQEMSHLKVVQNEFGSKVVIVSISIYESISNDKLKKFKTDYGLSWIVAKDTAEVHEEYGVPTVPTLHIIDQEGYMKYKHVGLTDSTVLCEEIRGLMTLPLSTLTVRTSSGLNNVHFKVDGADCYTSAGSFSVELSAGLHRVQLVDTVVKDGNDVEYRFLLWSGIASGSSNPLQIDVSASSVLEAEFQKYCKTVFTQTGSESTPEITVDGKSCDLPQTFWFQSGSSHSFAYGSIVDGVSGTQYVLLSASHSSPISIADPITVAGSYKTQHYITVTSDHGLPTPSQWVDEGNNISIQVTSPADDNGIGTRYSCAGYRIDEETLKAGTSCTFKDVQAPHKIEFQWLPQHRLIVASAQGQASPSNTNWYNSGDSVSAFVTSPADGDGQGTQYICTGWTGTGSVPSTGTGTSTEFFITSPSTLTWNWKHQYRITIVENGLEAGESITVNINGNSYTEITPLSHSEWFGEGSSVTFSVTYLLTSSSAGKRYMFVGWRDSADRAVASSHTVSGPETIAAQYQAQYYLSVNSEPTHPKLQPQVSPAGSWYSSGTQVTCIAPTSAKGYRYEYWLLDGATQAEGNIEIVISMDHPHEAIALYTPITDLNLDARTDESDIEIITGAFKSKEGDRNYDPQMDFDFNGIINIIDITAVTKKCEAKLIIAASFTEELLRIDRFQRRKMVWESSNMQCDQTEESAQLKLLKGKFSFF